MQAREQFQRATRAQHDFDVVAAEQWPQKADLEVARQRGERPDAHDLPRRAGFAQRSQQFRTRCKDGVGMVKRDAPGLGEVQLATAPFE